MPLTSQYRMCEQPNMHTFLLDSGHCDGLDECANGPVSSCWKCALWATNFEIRQRFRGTVPRRVSFHRVSSRHHVHVHYYFTLETLCSAKLPYRPAMVLDRRKITLFGAAATLRLVLCFAFPSLPNLLAGRVEISTPVTSFKRREQSRP